MWICVYEDKRILGNYNFRNWGIPGNFFPELVHLSKRRLQKIFFRFTEANFFRFTEANFFRLTEASFFRLTETNFSFEQLSKQAANLLLVESNPATWNIPKLFQIDKTCISQIFSFYPSRINEMDLYLSKFFNWLWQGLNIRACNSPRTAWAGRSPQRWRWSCRKTWLIAQHDDLCYSYLYFCVDHLYFTSQITKKYSIMLC